jgi:hypothetical protein
MASVFKITAVSAAKLRSLLQLQIGVVALDGSLARIREGELVQTGTYGALKTTK